MLTEEHIALYRISILQAAKTACDHAKTAEHYARLSFCSGCNYCSAIVRHKRVLEVTVAGLLDVVTTLTEGATSSRPFPSKMSLNTILFRGFIADDGEYMTMFNIDHCAFRENYVAEHGIDRAFRMIKVHSGNMRNELNFADRKYPPTEEQYRTIRDLLIQAEGDMRFKFEYDTNHPRPKGHA